LQALISRDEPNLNRTEPERLWTGKGTSRYDGERVLRRYVGAVSRGVVVVVVVVVGTRVVDGAFGQQSARRRAARGAVLTWLTVRPRVTVWSYRNTHTHPHTRNEKKERGWLHFGWLLFYFIRLDVLHWVGYFFWET
jgi:hypothetical protein